MYRIGLFFTILLFVILPPTTAQDGLDLPTDLYVLLNDGVIERYGTGNSGLQRIALAGEFILDFRVGPDANWVAYRTQAGLFAYHLYTGEKRTLEGPSASIPQVRGRGETLAWSPRADALAYTTLTGGRVYLIETQAFVDLAVPNLQHLVWSPDGVYLMAEANDNIWWIFKRDSLGLNLTSALAGANGAAWLGSGLVVFAPIEGGLNLMDLENANQQTALLASSDSYALPYVQADGTVLVYRLNSENTGRLLQVTLSNNRAEAFELSDVDVELNSLRWGPRGGVLVAFGGGVLALVNPLTGQGLVLPIASASSYSWGPLPPDETGTFTLSTPAYFTAPQAGLRQVWRLATGATEPTTITRAEYDISDYALAGDTLAYVANGALWVQRGEGDAQALVTLGSNQAIGPAFGPDGQTLYYRDEQATGAGIWRVNLTAPTPELFLADTATLRYFTPQPAPSVAALLVQVRLADNSLMLALVDTVSGEQRTLGAFERGSWLQGTTVAAIGEGIKDGQTVRGLYTLDINQADTPPNLLWAIPTEMILSYRLMAADTARVVGRANPFGLPRILDFTLATGETSGFEELVYLAQPHLSADGQTLIGLTHERGRLTAFRLPNREQITFSNLTNISQIIWP